MPDYRIGILTLPVSKAGIVPLSHLVTIISAFSKNIFLITGGEAWDVFRTDNRVFPSRISHTASTSIIKRIFYFILPQLKSSAWIFRTRKNVDVFIFFLGGETLLLPMITAYILRKKVIILFASSATKIHASNHDPLAFVLAFLERMTCTLADTLVVYAHSLIADYSLERWTGKIVIAREHYIDVQRFRIIKEFSSRDCIIGYVGRFSEEKGILQLLTAVPMIIRREPEAKFLFIGEGPLQDTIKHYIQKNNLDNTITSPGWVSHDQLAGYLNRMKLLVIPSDTEGLPNVMLEAMACGTPVLATPVGGIPDFIKDSRTGYILKNNSARCITSSIIEVLEDDKTADIIEHAHQLIHREFRFEKRIEEFRILFEETVQK